MSAQQTHTRRTRYTTLEGDVLDLGRLTEEERAHFERCYAAYKAGMDWLTFGDLVTGTENPLVRTTGGWITRAVFDHPLYQAIQDLEDRLGIQQGALAAVPEYDLSRDPLAAAESCDGLLDHPR